MQVKKIAALCALAFAGVSAHAAMTPAEQAVLNNANAAGRVIYISGASAVDAGFNQIIDQTFTGTTIRFINSQGYKAVAGTLAAGTGTWAGQPAIIINRTKGGSVWGVNPVARAQSIESMDVTAAACGASGAGTSASPYTCTLTNMVPDAGVSDVAPALFKAPYNTEGEVAAESLTDAELAELAIAPIYGLAFGVPVTNNVGNIALNKAAVTAIMAGNVSNWSQLGDAPADIVICRRVPGSGTQAVENLYFGSYPCAAAANVPADRYASGAWDEGSKTYTAANGAGGLIVIENSSSSQVRSCLDKAVTGGTYNTSDRDGNAVTVDFGAGGYKAIGVLSMDSLSSSKTTGNWQFRSLDGAGTITWDNTANPVATSGTGKFPTKAALVDGTWDMVGMISFNVPSRTTGAKAEVLTKFLENAQSPAILASQSSLKNVTASPAGTPDPTATGNVMRAEYANGDQCAPYSRNY